ncbi:MAG: hypothetical protein IJW62_06720 [Clostridia bacterium]|nr:hypothetical protein [Clostridia bacterium]
MYSRKYIRAALPEAARREYYSSAPLSGKGGREPSPPPDYTGTVFADPDALRQRNRQDFPEAVIPPREEEPADEQESQSALPLFSEEAPMPLSTEEPPLSEPAPIPASEAPPEEESLADLPSEQVSPPPSGEPLLSLDLLRSLTLEDLMLYWMLLMLLTCSQEDQVYLLLGLLLLNR